MTLFDESPQHQPKPKRCPECDGKIVEYRHRLSRPLVAGLVRLERNGGGPINLGDLAPPLTYSQRCNFQKLRYFGLVAGVDDDDGPRSGIWELTEAGMLFLAGRLKVQSHVWTFRGSPTGFEGDARFVHEIDGGYQSWREWAAEAQPHPRSDV